MKKYSKILLSGLTMMLFVGLYSCNKETANKDIDGYVEDATANIQLETRTGNGDCFELVWPVSISYPDGITEEIASLDEMKAAVKTWREANPGVRSRPELVYPVSVITEDGTVVTVQNKLELKRLFISCKVRPHLGDKRPCFRLNYPISINYPDGSSTSYDTPRAMAIALKQWRKNNPNSAEHPTIGFPITVTMRDGTEIIVDSKEALKALKEGCR